jgi:hypothetical protein
LNALYIILPLLALFLGVTFSIFTMGPRQRLKRVRVEEDRLRYRNHDSGSRTQTQTNRLPIEMFQL